MKINVERMRYKNDSLSFTLCMLALIADVIQFTLIYSNSVLSSLTGVAGFNYYTIGIDIIVNILFMLFAFYVGEELKTYHIKWAIAPIIMGVLQIYRIFDFPKSMMKFGFITEKLYRVCVICLVFSAVCLFIASVNTFIKSTMLNRYLKTVDTSPK